MSVNRRLGALGLLLLMASASAATPSPPVWPEQLHAVLLQNRSGVLADVDLYYDYPGGRNLNIIASRKDGSVLWDNERSNGSTYYYYLQQQTCRTIDMGVGLLRPNWLDRADYLGVDEINGKKVNVFAKNSTDQHPFITYYADVQTSEPVRWIFFDNAIFDVLKWAPFETLEDEQWQLPAYCFNVQDDSASLTLVAEE